MRQARIFAPDHHPKAFYHCISRTVGREFLLGDEEKEQFVKYMRAYEALYGVRVISFCIMSNHFHILLEVPKRPETLPSDAELIALTRQAQGNDAADALEKTIQGYYDSGDTTALDAFRASITDRMWSVSTYMKTLKQRFTQWYNRRKKRTGTMWSARYHSVLVEHEGRALKKMASYIDLNPVRAKMCDDPKDYRWCSYAEAVAGKTLALESLYYLTTVSNAGGLKPDEFCPSNQKESLEMWRRILYGVPEHPAHAREYLRRQRKGEQIRKQCNSEADYDILHTTYRRIPREKALEVLAKGGSLSSAELLSCRVRYFCDGAALGSKSFVEEIFQTHREKFGKTREDGARKIKGLLQEVSDHALHTLRDLRKEVIT